MEYIETLKNSFSYAFSDFKQLLKLSIPNLIAGAIFGIAMVLMMIAFSGDYGYYYYYYEDPTYIAAMVMMFIGYIVGLIALIFDYGVMVNVVKETIRGSSQLPELQIGRFFIDGLKYVVVSIVYFIVPIIIYAVFILLGISTESYALIIIGIIIYAVLLFIVYLLMPVITGKLAETDSMSEAVSIQNIFNITGNIGWGTVFIMLLLLGIVTSIIVTIAIFINFIPFIGQIIFAVVLSMLLIVGARVWGFIYLEQYGTNFNANYQQPNPINYQQQNYQQINQANIPQGIPQQNTQNIPQTNPNDYQVQNNVMGTPQDFQPQNQATNPQQNYQQQNTNDFQPQNQATNPQQNYQQQNTNDFQPQNMKICPICGQQNPSNNVQCMNCGNQIQ